MSKDSITVKELRAFLNKLPENFDNFGIINGEYGRGKDDEFYYRIDKPVIFLTVDEETEELCILHQSEQEVNNIIYQEKKDDDKSESESD